MAPYRGGVDFEDLSPFNRKVLKMQNYRDYRRRKYNSKKLLATFYPRKKYVTLLDNLQYYLKKGLKLVRIRIAVKFIEEEFLNPFGAKLQNWSDFRETSYTLPKEQGKNVYEILSLYLV